jgi:hypothetical protein
LPPAATTAAAAVPAFPRAETRLLSWEELAPWRTASSAKYTWHTNKQEAVNREAPFREAGALSPELKSTVENVRRFLKEGLEP